ncbi:DegV family protein [Paenibacillus sp. CGMCC 1.16610]|uniref:DegV family EDD domain-containing protein n=1 Tax=Paenibacillus anseongense TaxID=2682845 RepID=A0ABW9UGH2_9BACL|nr:MULTISPECIES: DegV family protein [Paenibacillus]MBA2937917.1 DegV family protein [Paenibacillus sp. CGMCC 1.16610]MVQ36975.1 DegV family EDD domain-containing protein [Paenibacillus anseongense]
MTHIRIVTDSTADIPLALRQELNIEMVPLKIHFGDEQFLDAVTLRSEEFYPKLTSSPHFPRTSQPSPAEFLGLYQSLLEEPNTEIISIHLSSALSGTYQSALLASTMLEESAGKVHVVDSRSASYGIGALVVAAAKAAQAGQSAAEIIELVQTIRENFYIYFLVDTLEFLQKGGRIGKASALFGSLLNIKPILSIDGEGEVAATDKVRGQKKAIARILELLAADVPNRRIPSLHIAHANNLEGAELLRDVITQQFEVQHVDYITLGPVIGAHAGPGTIAAFVRAV